MREEQNKRMEEWKNERMSRSISKDLSNHVKYVRYKGKIPTYPGMYLICKDGMLYHTALTTS